MELESLHLKWKPCKFSCGLPKHYQGNHCLLLTLLCDTSAHLVAVVWHLSSSCRCCVTSQLILSLFCDSSAHPVTVVWHLSSSCCCCVTSQLILSLFCDSSTHPVTVVWQLSSSCHCCVTPQLILSLLCDTLAHVIPLLRDTFPKVYSPCVSTGTVSSWTGQGAWQNQQFWQWDHAGEIEEQGLPCIGYSFF